MKARAERRSRPGGVPAAPAVHLHIERLVLDGIPLPAAQARQLQSTLERELGRMLARAPAESWNGGATRQLPAAPVHLAPGDSPAVWGRQIARTLVASLTPPARAPAPSAKAVPTPDRKPF